MSDDQGKLTQEEKGAAGRWLKDHWKGSSACAVCHANNWSVCDHLVAPVKTTDKGGVVIGGAVYPQVMVICMDCGNTLFFNAALMKVVESEAKPESGDSDGEK